MKPRYFVSLLFCYCCFIRKTNGARVLGIFPLNMPSHFSMYQEALRALLNRGHRVDVVSHFPFKKTHANYTHMIDLSGKTKPIIENETPGSIDSFRIDHRAEILGNDICNILAIPELQSLIKNPPNDPPYDIVITELYFANCFIAFGRHLKVPVVSISTSSVPHYVNEAVGNPFNPSFVPEYETGSSSSMDFWQRVENMVSTIWTTYRVKSITEKQTKIVKKYFGDEMPGVRELEKDLSLVLVNSHPSLNGVRPSTPAVIEVGGLHIRDDKIEFPADLKRWLDESEKGVVYVSFGSLVRIESFSKETLAALYVGFEQLAPVRVLIRAENPDALPAGLPKNVLAIKYFPQLQILKHKNIMGFVTHGGLMGIQDAVTARVPFLGIPIFGEQFRNVKNCVDRGVAVSLQFEDLTADNFVDAVNIIVQHPIYKTNMIALSKEFLDRVAHPRDTVGFWIEYIIKYGANSLRSPAVNLSWWQLALLDIYSSLIFTVLLTIYLTKRLVKILVRRLRPDDIMLPTTKKRL